MPRRASEIEPLPWMSPKAVEVLEGLLRPEWKVLEHGSGGSTLWFAERVAQVFAVEYDPDWFRAVQELAPRNVTLFLSSLPVMPMRFHENEPYDLVLIDGEPIEYRAAWLRTIAGAVRPGGWVVLDNANRAEYVAEREALKKQAAEYMSLDGNVAGSQFMFTDFFRMPEKEAKDESRNEPEPERARAGTKRNRTRRNNASA